MHNFLTPVDKLPGLDLEKRYEVTVAGVDEAGRGPLAGPVVAAAVIIDTGNIIKGINDSKKMSAALRGRIFSEITKHYYYGIGIVNNNIIDEINILNATKLACIRAVDALPIKPEIILVDGNMKFDKENFISIVKGDNISISIAAASIVAKVTRDNIMQKLHKMYPEYSWDKNVGYGTFDHIRAIKKVGLSPFHRKSFKLKSAS